LIPADEFSAEVVTRGFNVIAGVPCSYLAGPIKNLTDQGRYIPAANEGAAVAIACGAAAGGTRSAVIAQNSGFGNLVNPLTSLQATYRIPLLVFMTLRGWPDPAGDEPQHALMGSITHRMLDLIGARHWTLQPSLDSLRDALDGAATELAARHCAFILVPKATVSGSGPGSAERNAAGLTRTQAIDAVLSRVRGLPIVSTTGYTSRTLFALNDRPEHFYMQGSMGHAAAFALGLAAQRRGSVVVLDGDGAVLMHMGTMSTIGAAAPVNLLHVVLDNRAYESTGLQPTTSATTDFCLIARATGYASAVSCDSAEEVGPALTAALAAAGPHLIVVRVCAAADAAPPRATSHITAPDIYRRFSGTVTESRAWGTLRPGRASGGRPRVIFGAGALASLRSEVARYQPGRILVVASAARAESADLRAILADRNVNVFSGFTPNPTLDQILAGCAVRDRWLPDLIVGMGGGSAMDVAKAVRLLPADREPALTCLRDGPAADFPGRLTSTPLILVPTTAGTGSEVTQFATLFDGQKKLSLDHQAVIANLVIVDPEAATGCPLPVTSSCAMDALCHAVESLWAISSTPASASDASAALAGLRAFLDTRMDHLALSDWELLSTAALLAGAAINVTRTTAAHAFAYHLTAQFGIPHGVSCLINLSWLFDYNRNHVYVSCADPRGSDYVNDQLNDIAKILCTDPDEVSTRLLGLLSRNGWPTQLRGYGIAAEHIPDIVTAGLGYGRSRGNPVRLDPAAIANCLMRRL
jgi:phosphonopyruvate decarboxylase